MPKTKQKTLNAIRRRKQYAALPTRFTGKGKMQVLLLTSRGTGRWVIPKGWPMRKLSPGAAAAREAYEEAGLEGTIEATDRSGTTTTTSSSAATWPRSR